VESNVKRYNFKDRTGEKYTTNEGYEIEVIEYFNTLNCTITFTYNGYTKHNVPFWDAKKGEVKNPFHPSVHNVGYFGVGEYKATVNRKSTIVYSKWVGMLYRGYNNLYIQSLPNRKSVIVCREWHNFQVFAKWFEDNYKPHMEGWHLDKDILVKGNREYSPQTCCFVPSEINILFSSCKIDKKELPKGVCLNNGTGKKYRCTFSKVYLGKFDTIEETFQVYKDAKEKRIKKIADEWKSQITEQTYQALINYTVEITD